MNEQVDDDLSVRRHFDVEWDGRLAVQTLQVATFAEVADLESANGKEQKQAQQQTREKPNAMVVPQSRQDSASNDA